MKTGVETGPCGSERSPVRAFERESVCLTANTGVSLDRITPVFRVTVLEFRVTVLEFRVTVLEFRAMVLEFRAAVLESGETEREAGKKYFRR
jgi:hypothetical protein